MPKQRNRGTGIFMSLSNTLISILVTAGGWWNYEAVPPDAERRDAIWIIAVTSSLLVIFNVHIVVMQIIEWRARKANGKVDE